GLATAPRRQRARCKGRRRPAAAWRQYRLGTRSARRFYRRGHASILVGGAAEADVALGCQRVDIAAMHRAREERQRVPIAAPDDLGRAGDRTFGIDYAPVPKRLVVLRIIPVIDPFRYVACQVIDTVVATTS